MHTRDVWVAVPVGVNLFWLFAVSIAGSASFPTDAVGCTLVALMVSGTAIGGIAGFVIHDIGPAKSLLSMIAQTIVLIFLYAIVYFHGMRIPSLTFWDALYYSVATWTSLGDAELTLPPHMRIVTASQAITGYVFLGLLVGVLASLVGQPKKGSQSR